MPALLPPNATISTVLEEAGHTPQLLRGTAGTFFAIPGTDHYVLRIENRALRRAPSDIRALLSHYTHLTPPYQLIVGTNIGQTLLTTPDYVVSILERANGIPLSAYTTPRGSSDCYAKALLYTRAMREIMDMASGTAHDASPPDSRNPLVPLFRNACALAHLGYTPNFYHAHVFIDTQRKQLTLVNQLSEHYGRSYHEPDADIDRILNNCCQQLLHGFTLEHWPTPSSSQDSPLAAIHAEYDSTFAAFKRFVTTTKSNVVYAYCANQPEPLQLVRPVPRDTTFSAVEHTLMVPLDGPSHLLLQKLRDVEEAASFRQTSR